MTEPTLKEIALAELTRRRELALAVVRSRQRTLAQVEPQVKLWAAIAAWTGADVRAQLIAASAALAAKEGAPVWIDFCPATEPAHRALTRIAQECQRAALEALRRHETAPSDETEPRARNLLRLANHIAAHAGLPAMPLIKTEAKAAA